MPVGVEELKARRRVVLRRLSVRAAVLFIACFACWALTDFLYVHWHSRGESIRTVLACLSMGYPLYIALVAFKELAPVALARRLTLSTAFVVAASAVAFCLWIFFGLWFHFAIGGHM